MAQNRVKKKGMVKNQKLNSTITKNRKHLPLVAQLAGAGGITGGTLEAAAGTAGPLPNISANGLPNCSKSSEALVAAMAPIPVASIPPPPNRSTIGCCGAAAAKNGFVPLLIGDWTLACASDQVSKKKSKEIEPIHCTDVRLPLLRPAPAVGMIHQSRLT